jgi:hypothetical protein
MNKKEKEDYKERESPSLVLYLLFFFYSLYMSIFISVLIEHAVACRRTRVVKHMYNMYLPHDEHALGTCLPHMLRLRTMYL